MNVLLFKKASISFLIRVVGVGIAFFAQISLAQMLSVDGYGNLIYTVQFVGLLAVVGSLGLAQAAVRIIPSANIDGDLNLRRQFIRFSIIVSILISIFVAAISSTVRNVIDATIREPFDTFLMPASMALLASMTLLQLAQGLMRSDKNIIGAQLGEQIFLPMGLICLVGWAVFKDQTYSPALVITFQAGLCFSVAIVLIALVYRTRPWKVLHSEIAERPSRAIQATRKKDWLAIGLPLAMAALMANFLSRGDVVILGFIADPSQIGAYAAAARVTGLMIFGLAAVNTIASPIFSELWHQRKTAELQSRVDDAVALSTLATLPVFLVLLTAPEFVLSFFGDEFLIASSVLQILAVGQLINALTGSVGPLMVATGQSRAYAVISLFGIVITFVGVIGFTSLFGINGAALGVIFGMSAMNLILVWRIYACTGIRSALKFTIFKKQSLEIYTQIKTRLRQP